MHNECVPGREQLLKRGHIAAVQLGGNKIYELCDGKYGGNSDTDYHRCRMKGSRIILEEIRGNLDQITPREDGDAVVGREWMHEVGTMAVMNIGMCNTKICTLITMETQSVALALGSIENRVVPREMDMTNTEDSRDMYKVKVMLT